VGRGSGEANKLFAAFLSVPGITVCDATCLPSRWAQHASASNVWIFRLRQGWRWVQGRRLGGRPGLEYFEYHDIMLPVKKRWAFQELAPPSPVVTFLPILAILRKKRAPFYSNVQYKAQPGSVAY